MTKKPTPKPKSARAERAEALARMTKAELVRTVHALDKRITPLLNRIASLEQVATDAKKLVDALEQKPTVMCEACGVPVTASHVCKPPEVPNDVLPRAGEAVQSPPAFPWEKQ
jgi:hypothetical protein